MNFLKTRSIDLDDTAGQQPSILLQKLYSKSWVRLHIRLNCKSKFKAISGLSRQPHTVSFTLVDYPGYVMTTRGNELFGDLRPHSSRKAACCTFFPMPNLWFPGYISYESTEKSSHYIRIRDNLLFMELYDGTTDFKEDASFIMNKRQSAGLGAFTREVDEEESPIVEDFADSGWSPTPLNGSLNETSASKLRGSPVSDIESAYCQMDKEANAQTVSGILQTATTRFAEPGCKLRSKDELVSRFATLWRRHSDSSLPSSKANQSSSPSQNETQIRCETQTHVVSNEMHRNEMPAPNAVVYHDDLLENELEFSPLLQMQERLVKPNRRNYKFTFLDSESESEISREDCDYRCNIP